MTKIVNHVLPLFRRWNAKRRYHTAATQALSLIQQVTTCLFLLSGWHRNAIVLLGWVVYALAFSLFIQSQMETLRPSQRALRHGIRAVEVLLSLVTTVLIILFAGTFQNIVVLCLVYVATVAITTEFRGDRRIHFG